MHLSFGSLNSVHMPTDIFHLQNNLADDVERTHSGFLYQNQLHDLDVNNNNTNSLFVLIIHGTLNVMLRTRHMN